MSDALKGVGTVVFTAGVILSKIYLPSEQEITDIFLSLLSAIWVLPPVASALRSMFKA
jgi:hypothetical protein